MALEVPRWWAVSLKGERLSSERHLIVFTRTVEIERGLRGCLFTSYTLHANKVFLCREPSGCTLVHSGRVFHGSLRVPGDAALPSSMHSGLSLPISFISLTTKRLMFLLLFFISQNSRLLYVNLSILRYGTNSHSLKKKMVSLEIALTVTDPQRQPSTRERVKEGSHLLTVCFIWGHPTYSWRTEPGV